MTDAELSRCGLDCKTCAYRLNQGCPGCQEAEAELHWGQCVLSRCCVSKNLDNCGQCEDFPCATLNEHSYDKEHGDQGARIENLRRLRCRGQDEQSSRLEVPSAGA